MGVIRGHECWFVPLTFSAKGVSWWVRGASFCFSGGSLLFLPYMVVHIQQPPPPHPPKIFDNRVFITSSAWRLNLDGGTGMGKGV